MSMRIAVLVVLAGCVGGIETEGGGTPPTTVDSSPLATFESSVAPILSRCAGCHTSASNAPNFVDTVAATEYQKVTSQPVVIGDFSAAGAPLLSTIVAGGHNGMAYSSAEVATITGWLTKEVAVRMPTTTTTTTTNPSQPQIIAALEDQWSGCLTLGDFTSANMADAWGNLMAEDPQEACETCHVTGGNNFIASDNGPQFFSYISTKRNYMLQYFAVDVDHGAPKMIVNWTSFSSVNGGGINNAHPLFSLNNDGMTALTAFYDLAASRLAQGACGAKALTD